MLLFLVYRRQHIDKCLTTRENRPRVGVVNDCSDGVVYMILGTGCFLLYASRLRRLCAFRYSIVIACPLARIIIFILDSYTPLSDFLDIWRRSLYFSVSSLPILLLAQFVLGQVLKL